VSLQRANLRTLVTPTLALASSINVFLVLFIGGPMAIRGELSVGELIAFTQLVALLAPPLRGLTFTLHIFKQAQASLDRLAEVMDPKPERPDLPHPKTVPTAPPRIELRDLSFAWPDAPDMPVLKNLTLDIPAGSTLGILGPVGAGKSALIQLVARLYNPPPGTLLVDGVDIRELDLAAWRRVVATVPQRAFLFSESLQDNILLGGPDDGRLKHILELVALDSDVEILPQGKDTVVGEAGLMLSGGQRQRTALARGLLRNPLVLLLDDVLSAVDHATERQLVDTLDQAARRPTTLIVAHRVSALQHADRIIVLDGGRILDSGPHDELVERPGPYRETWLRQAESEVA
jgi:ATP-binding cassette subfamily B protein